jgi:hypothetical protein
LWWRGGAARRRSSAASAAVAESARATPRQRVSRDELALRILRAAAKMADGAPAELSEA